MFGFRILSIFDHGLRNRLKGIVDPETKKKIIFKLLFFLKKSDRYIFFSQYQSIFKNKSMEIKKYFHIKNFWTLSLIFNIKIHIFFLKNRALIY